MTRMPPHRAVLVGTAAGLAIVAGVAIWSLLPSRVPVAIGPSRAPEAVAFHFAPWPAPRQLPVLHFTDAAGRQLTLADFHGRLVLFNLWATWCAPCRKEMPTLDRLQASLRRPDFEVVALSIDLKGLAAVRPFYGQLGLKALHIYLDPSGEAAHELAAPGIPMTLLIDRRGREIGRAVGPADWESPAVTTMIRKYLAAATVETDNR